METGLDTYLQARLPIALPLSLALAQALLLLLLHCHALLLHVLLDRCAHRAIRGCALLVVLEEFSAGQAPAADHINPSACAYQVASRHFQEDKGAGGVHQVIPAPAKRRQRRLLYVLSG